MKTEALEMVREQPSLTLPEECMRWVDKQVESRRCHNRSYAIDVLILERMKG